MRRKNSETHQFLISGQDLPEKREHKFFLLLLLFFKEFYFSLYFLAVLGLHCCVGFSLVAASGGYSSCDAGVFLLRWPFSLWSVGSRVRGLQELVACGLGSCDSWALEHRLSSCGPRT